LGQPWIGNTGVSTHQTPSINRSISQLGKSGLEVSAIGMGSSLEAALAALKVVGDRYPAHLQQHIEN
jgi:hypothetical protein